MTDKTTSAIDRVTGFLVANGETHKRWAEYFEANPEVEAEYVAMGTWDDAKEHRRLEAGYREAVTLIQSLARASRIPLVPPPRPTDAPPPVKPKRFRIVQGARGEFGLVKERE